MISTLSLPHASCFGLPAVSSSRVETDLLGAWKSCRCLPSPLPSRNRFILPVSLDIASCSRGNLFVRRFQIIDKPGEFPIFPGLTVSLGSCGSVHRTAKAACCGCPLSTMSATTSISSFDSCSCLFYLIFLVLCTRGCTDCDPGARLGRGTQAGPCGVRREEVGAVLCGGGRQGEQAF